MIYFISDYLNNLAKEGEVTMDCFAVVDNESGKVVGSATYVPTGEDFIKLIRTSLSRLFNIKESYTVRFTCDGVDTDFRYNDKAGRFIPASFKDGLYPNPAMAIVAMEDVLKDLLGSYATLDELKLVHPVIVKVGETVAYPPKTDLMHWRASLLDVLNHCLDKVGPISSFHIGFFTYLIQVRLVNYQWQVEVLEHSYSSKVENTLEDINIPEPVLPEIEVIKDESHYIQYVFNQSITDDLFRALALLLIQGFIPNHVSQEQYLIEAFLSSRVTLQTEYTSEIQLETDKEDIDNFARDLSNGISNTAIFIASNTAPCFTILVCIDADKYSLRVPCEFTEDGWKVKPGAMRGVGWSNPDEKESNKLNDKEVEEVSDGYKKVYLHRFSPEEKAARQAKESDVFDNPNPPKKDTRSALKDDNSTTYRVIGLSLNAVKSAVIDSVIKRENANPDHRFLAIAEELSKRYREDTGYSLTTVNERGYITLFFEDEEIANVEIGADGLVIFYEHPSMDQIAQADINDSKAIAHIIIRCVKNAH